MLTSHGTIDYDYLILGAGSVTNFFGLESVERHAFDLKKLIDAERLRNQILTSFERAVVEPDPAKRRALMTFVIGAFFLRETKDAVTVRTARETVVLPVADVASRKPTNLSIMPDGLFDQMKPEAPLPFHCGAAPGAASHPSPKNAM